MKLELKHLAPYLPYELKILYHGNQRKMNAGNGSSTNWIGITATLQRQGKNCKPILRNISNLTKEELIKKGFWHHIDFLTHEKQNPIEAPYFMVEYLLSKHFDVFGLIESELAIDINTLEK